MLRYPAIKTLPVASKMLPLENWLAQSTGLPFGSMKKLERVPSSRQSHILVQVRQTCSGRMLLSSIISGPQILHRCGRRCESGLQGEFSRGILSAYYFVNVKQREQTLLPSARNSVEGHLALLETTSCNILISPVESKVDHILSKRDMRHFRIEGLREFLGGDFSEHYDYNKTFEEAAQDPFIIVHTSGSTGLPKPIILYHGGVAAVDNQHLIPPLDGFDAQINIFEGGVRVFTSLPPFHVRQRSSHNSASGMRNRTDQCLGGGYPTDPISRSVLRNHYGLGSHWSAYQRRSHRRPT